MTWTVRRKHGACHKSHTTCLREKRRTLRPMYLCNSMFKFEVWLTTIISQLRHDRDEVYPSICVRFISNKTPISPSIIALDSAAIRGRCRAHYLNANTLRQRLYRFTGLGFHDHGFQGERSYKLNQLLMNTFLLLS